MISIECLINVLKYVKSFFFIYEQSIPPPGSYEVSQAYSKSQGKIESKRETPNSAFLSSNGRFVPPHDVVLNETDVLNPGNTIRIYKWETI